MPTRFRVVKTFNLPDLDPPGSNETDALVELARIAITPPFGP